MKKFTFLLFCLIASWHVSAQFNENFDTGTTLPTGWSIINLGGANGWTVSASIDGGAHSGTNAARLVYNATAHNDYLITPQINVAANVNDQIEFWVKSRGTTFLEPYEVRLSTTTNAEAAFTVVLQASQTAPATWAKKTFDLSPYIGQSVYVAIRATGTNQFEFYVDDVVNSAAPTCLPVSGVTSTVTTNSATVAFTASTSNPANGYQYELRTSGAAGSGATGLVTSGTGTAVSYPLNTLTPNTSYTFYVRAVCSGTDSSTWESKVFKTLPIPPVNDNCSGAVTLTPNANLTCTSITASTLVGATPSGESLPTSIGNPDNDVWFKFVATSTRHRIIISEVVGAPLDLVHELLGGSCGGGLYNLSISDPDTSLITDLTIGETYYIRVFSKLAAVDPLTTFKICIGTPPPAPVNDECANAITLTVNANLACGTVTAGTNAYASASAVATTSLSGTPNNDVWFKFVATNARHRISLANVVAVEGTSVDMAMGVYDGVGGCGDLAFKATSDPDTFDVSGLVVNNVYFVRVYGYSVAQTNFNICVGTLPPAPANDECANAIALTVNNNYDCAVVTAGTNAYASASSQATTSLSGTPNADVWYSFTATAAAHRVSLTNLVAVVGTSVDMAMGVYDATGGCGALTFKATSDPNTLDLTGLVPNTVYLVRVYGYSVAQATFNICIGTPPPPPANDLIANAVVLTESTTTACNNALAGTTISATHSTEYACSTTDVDVWYTFTPASTGNYIFSRAVVSGTGNGYVSVYSGTPAALVRLNTSCSSTTFIQALTAGTTYYVSVSSTSTSPLSFNLCALLAPPAPANDLIANAAVLTESPAATCANAVAGTTLSATHSTEYACSTTDVDVWYTFTPASTGNYIFSRAVVSGTGNGYVSIYSGTPAALVRLNANCTSTSFTQALTAGTTYYVSVASTSTATLSFNLCTFLAPPAPSNDSCATPTALTAGATFATNVIVGTNLSATIQSGIADPTCGTSSFATTGKDVWFSVNAPASGTLTVETGTDAGSALVDTAIQVYRGTCAALVSVGCNDDITSGTNIFSKLALTALTAGEPLLVRVWSYGTTPSGSFKISAYDASLSAPTFDSASFKAYPNPVKDVLKLSYSQDMTSVSVFNLLGQQVINKSLNASEAQVDMSNLAAGTYLVKVVVDNQVKTIKVVKQ